MGKYVNPKTETKDEFLRKNGQRLSEKEFLDHEFDGEKLVCVLVDNGPFTAAIICYCENELNYVKDMTPRDERPTKHYLVDAGKLAEYL